MTPPNVTLSIETISRLKSHAEPLVDTYDTVINRALDALDAVSGYDGVDVGIRSYNPAIPPNLAYTTVKSVIFNGKRFPAAESYWNLVLLAAVREAAKKLPTKAVKDLIIVNSVLGKKEDNGYKFLEDVGVSVQGQDANGAWKGIYHIVKELKIPIEVTFIWQDNPKAASPGGLGMFLVN